MKQDDVQDEYVRRYALLRRRLADKYGDGAFEPSGVPEHDVHDFLVNAHVLVSVLSEQVLARTKMILDTREDLNPLRRRELTAQMDRLHCFIAQSTDDAMDVIDMRDYLKQWVGGLGEGERLP